MPKGILCRRLRSSAEAARVTPSTWHELFSVQSTLPTYNVRVPSMWRILEEATSKSSLRTRPVFLLFSHTQTPLTHSRAGGSAVQPEHAQGREVDEEGAEKEESVCG